MDYAIFLSSVTLFALSMCFTPGPNNALAMATGLDKGFWATLPHCLAVPVGGLTSLAALYLGLGQVFTRFPVVYEVLRYTGAVYMVWLAWRISGLGQRKTAQAQSSAKSAAAAASGPQGGITPLTFGQSFLLQFVNVKAWITNVVIISNYVGTGEHSRTRFWIVMALMAVMCFTSVAMWAAGGSFMRRFLTSDGMRRCNYVFAAFLLVSVVLLFV